MPFSSFCISVVARACMGLGTRFQVHHRAAIQTLPLSMIVTGLLFCASDFCIAQSPVTGLPVVDGGTLDPRTRALIKTHCGSCHGGEVKEAEINFDAYDSVQKARDNVEVWLKVRQVLNSQQMPPPDAPQPDEADLLRLISWTNAFLKAEAKLKAGDPGEVSLRRLSNAEYDYAIRDLTGLTVLNPTRDLPVDGAAGEGFTNVGSGQAMSPSLLGKYLDSAKRVAEHLVLLPTGIEFSPSTTQRDRTNEKLADIQAFYRRYTADGGGSAVDLQGIKFQTNQGGLLPIKLYLQTLLESREILQAGDVTVAAVASQTGLNQRYLSELWNMLAGTGSNSFLIVQLRTAFQRATVDEVDSLLTKINQAQNGFWKFNSIGHIGRQGGPQRWMEPIIPVVDEQELRLPLGKADEGNVIPVCLTVHDLGDGDAQDFVVWQEPRLLLEPDARGAQDAIMLRDVNRLSAKVRSIQQRELAQTSGYFKRMLKSLKQPGTLQPKSDQAFDTEGLNRDLLASWFAYAGLKREDTRRVDALFTSQMSKVQGYDAIKGWGVAATPSMLTNRSEESISFLTLTIPPRAVVVHPSPSSAAVVAWKSPVAGNFELDCSIADADNKCGNGSAWRIEHRTKWGTKLVAEGVMDNGGGDRWTSTRPLNLDQGDVVALMILARDKNHSCDTTHVELKLVEKEGLERKWILSEQVVDRVHEGNPIADTFGHADVWNFGQSVPESALQIPDGSALSAWRSQAILLMEKPEVGKERELARLADEIQRVVTTDEHKTLSAADQELRKQIFDWRGPLSWISLGKSSLEESDQQASGEKNALSSGLHPDGSKLQPNDLCTHGTSTLHFDIPAEFKAAELVTNAKMHAASGVEGAVQLQVHDKRIAAPEFDFGGTFLVHPEGLKSERIRSSVRSFAEFFPPALCYSRIVPVDEVVTLRLFHREDDYLSRLMLNPAETRDLDRLWNELLFVSDEPLKLAVSFEQIAEFATQDRPDLVTAFEPLREPINRRADEFGKRKMALEPLQLTAVVNFTERAWRQRLDGPSRQRLMEFYRRRRDEGMQHPRALQALVVRVLTAPEFLYKLESPQSGTGQSDVNAEALASRLSFFLWSSVPDSELMELGRLGKLHDEQVMRQQMRRMLKDPRAKRLAEQFACQWLHFRDFDRNDDKNEKLYPNFAALRKSMYGETIRFFQDMFQHNGSILDMIDADHTFVDQALAEHYGLEWDPDKQVSDEFSSDGQWQRIDGPQLKGRGGVLGMATFLASQSGASRTSPILRGNWIFETLLGEHLPRPPADVPLLPESVPEGLTSRELIEKHSSLAACAKCHAHIDGFGFALEGYDALGGLRKTVVDTEATLVDGRVIAGSEGLRHYLLNERREEVVRQFCRKLLGFALGREVLLSDEPLLDQMQLALRKGDYHFEIAVEQIITSPQFCQIRDEPKSFHPQSFNHAGKLDDQ